MNKVPISKMIKEFNLKLLLPEIDLSNRYIIYNDINRLALQLTGFFDYFPFQRLQIIGLVEHTYLKKLSHADRKDVMRKIFQYKLPAIVVCRGLEPFPEMLFYAKKNKVPILSTDDTTTDFICEVIRWLKKMLAPRRNIHGVLIDIYGEGVLIMGESGIGKSETAIELIRRGHRFVADDVVEVTRISQRTLIGTCPKAIKNLMELRGIGIVDIKKMFGTVSVKDMQTIDLVIKLENWQENEQYDRLGFEDEYTEIMGNKVRSYSIPIRPGRNLAVICEAAAINHRQKEMGCANSFIKEIDDKLKKG